MKLSIIVTDSGPLITLAVADALDVLLLLGLPVLVPDMVRFEVIRHQDKPGAQVVAAWLRSHEGNGVTVSSTEVYEEFEALRTMDPGTKTKNRGEQAAAEVLERELQSANHGAVLLFEESNIRKQNFLLRLPDEVVVLSTSKFLDELQDGGLIPDANAILLRATSVRGNEIAVRRTHSTESVESPKSLHQRMRP